MFRSFKVGHQIERVLVPFGRLGNLQCSSGSNIFGCKLRNQDDPKLQTISMIKEPKKFRSYLKAFSQLLVKSYSIGPWRLARMLYMAFADHPHTCWTRTLVQSHKARRTLSYLITGFRIFQLLEVFATLTSKA